MREGSFGSLLARPPSRPAFATMTATGGMTSAMQAQTIASVGEKWGITKPDNANRVTHVPISTKYGHRINRQYVRDGLPA